MSFFRYQPLGGPLYFYFTAVFFYTVMNGLWILYKRMREVFGNERAQLKIFLIGTLIGYSGGATLFLQAHKLNILPIGVFFISFYVLFTGYAIYRYGFLNIEVLVKKTLVFGSLFTIVFGVFVGTTLLLQQFIVGDRIIGLALSSILMIFTVRPLEDFLIKATDQYLFQKKYDYRQVMKSFIDDVVTLLDLNKIIAGTMELLDKTLHPQSSAILLITGNKGRYISYDGKFQDIENSSSIPGYLKSAKSILSIETEKDKKISEKMKDEMIRLKADLAVPLMVRDDLIGMILLGKKKSDEYYTAEDLNILMDLSRTEAIAIKNAQLTQEIADKSEQKGVDKTSMGAAHQMKNILAEINVGTEAIYFDLKYKYPNTDDITLEQAKSFMGFAKEKIEKILKQTEKGTGALDAILYPAKAKDDFALLNVFSLIKQALTSSSQVKSKDILERNIPAPVVTNSVPENFPHIVGNEKLLEHVLRNLINNAYDAILWRYSYLNPDSSYRGKITVTAEDKAGTVTINVEDNGIGMKDDVKEKLFAGFFTTKSVQRKGDGAGLYTMQDWISQHKGRISFTSEYGKGTIFTLELPKKQEN